MLRDNHQSYVFRGLLVIASLTISACDQTRDLLGLKRTNMDEFAVMDRDPLSTPPHYQLRPPLAEATSAKSTSALAKAALTGKKETSDMTAAPSVHSPAENALLAQTGATKADPSIRTQLAKELAQQQKATGDDLVFWNSDQSAQEKDVIDPIAEHKAHNPQS